MHSLRALLQGIVDYAGLFPPARLEMGPTVRNFAAYRAGPEAWMLGRLVVPAARLEEFERKAQDLLPPGDDDDELWVLTALVAPADDPRLAEDLAAVEAFNDRHVREDAGAAFIDSIELRAASPAAIDAALERMPGEVFPYFELPIDADFRGLVTALAGGEAGAKVRTGGLAPDAFPTPQQLARFVVACAKAEVPFKATAGLHHPIRRRDEEIGVHMHGFLNLFVGACMALCEGLDVEGVQEILLEESPAAFEFEDHHLAFRGRRLPTEEVESVRERFAHSFGSCSFEEPLADLRGISLLSVERPA